MLMYSRLCLLSCLVKFDKVMALALLKSWISLAVISCLVRIDCIFAIVLLKSEIICAVVVSRLIL